MRTLDRYLIRESLGPFALSLAVFTFILAVRPMLEQAGQLLAKGVALPTVGFLLLTLLPQALGVTIPMAFLSGILMALGRLSGDREAVALLACGVSPLRLFRPIAVLAVIVAGLDLYVMVRTVPDANQTFRETTYHLLSQQTDADIKPGLFYEGFPGKVLYVQASRPGGGWSGVFLADTTQPGRPVVTLAQQGQLVLDDAERRADLWLYDAYQYVPGSDPAARVYDTSQSRSVRYSIPAESVFGSGVIDRGLPEMTIADLQRFIAEDRSHGGTARGAVLYLQQKFSFPVACLVFALLGVALGLHTRREGKLAGITLGLVVITAYYGLLELAEAWTKGDLLAPIWARWIPNIVLGAAGILALWWRARSGASDRGLMLPGWVSRAWRSSRPASSPPGGGPRVALVVRVPRLALPRPRLLDLYVAARYLRMTALAFFGFLVLYYIGTVVDLSQYVFKGQVTASLMVRYLWYSTPQFIAYAIPIATLVAVLGTIGGLTRTSELTVMRACGISLYRAAVPLLALALVWSALLFMLGERMLAEANRQAEALNDTIRGHAPHTTDIANRNWLAGAGGRLYYYAVFDPRSRTLFDLSVFETVTRPYRLIGHTYASRAIAPAALPRAGSGALTPWQADNGWVQRFAQSGQVTRLAFAREPLELPPPASFRGAQVDADMMTFGELRDYIRRLGASGFSVAEQRVQLHGKIAFPLVTVVMTLLAVPFGVTTGRRGALYGIGLAIALAVAYWLFAYFFVALGTAALLPAPLAAWAANILFLAVALYLVLTVRT
jgi:lipopolysaccharide export system permease protein